MYFFPSFPNTGAHAKVINLGLKLWLSQLLKNIKKINTPMTDKWLFLQLQLACIIIPQKEFKDDV